VQRSSLIKAILIAPVVIAGSIFLMMLSYMLLPIFLVGSIITIGYLIIKSIDSESKKDDYGELP